MNAETFFDLERVIRYLRDLERRVTRLEEEAPVFICEECKKAEVRPQA